MAIKNEDFLLVNRDTVPHKTKFSTFVGDTIHVGTNPPAAERTTPGSLWYCTDDGRFYTYINAGVPNWIEAAPPFGAPLVNLTYLPSGDSGTVDISGDGTDAIIPVVSNTFAGLMSPIHLSQLNDATGLDLQSVTDNGNHTDKDVKIGNTEASPKIELKADGSGSFAKDVKAGERDPSNDTDARGVRIAVDTVNGGVYTQCRGDSADPGALMAFQALVGDDERFVVKYDGSAEFAGDVKIGDFSSTEGNYLFESGGIYCKTSGTNQELLRLYEDSTINTRLFSDGRANFAGIVQSGSADITSETATGATLNDRGNILIQRPDGATSSDIYFSGYSGTTRTVRINGDGSSTFAGKLTINDPVNSEGIELYPDGRLFTRIDNIDDDKSVLGFYKNGYDESAARVQFKADGSAKFAGNVESTTYNVSSSSGSGYQISSNGALTAQRSSGTAAVFRGYHGTSQNVTINADGSGEFSYYVTVDDSVRVGQNPELASTYGVLIRNAGQITARSENPGDLVFRTFQGNQNLTTGAQPTISFAADGSAEFAGDIEVGGDPQEGATAGLKLWAQGQIDVARTSGTQALFKGYTVGNNTPTTRIDADGSATFANRITGENQIRSQYEAGNQFFGIAKRDDLVLSNIGSANLSAAGFTVRNTTATAGAFSSFQFQSQDATNLTLATLIGFSEGSGNNGGLMHVSGSNNSFRFASDGNGLKIGNTYASPNISLNAGGSASFSNTVQSPSFFGNNTGNSQVWVGGASTSIITADGSATFAGNVDASTVNGVNVANVGAALTSLKTAAAAATDLDTLKAAIASALTNF